MSSRRRPLNLVVMPAHSGFLGRLLFPIPIFSFKTPFARKHAASVCRDIRMVLRFCLAWRLALGKTSRRHCLALRWQTRQHTVFTLVVARSVLSYVDRSLRIRHTVESCRRRSVLLDGRRVGVPNSLWSWLVRCFFLLPNLSSFSWPFCVVVLQVLRS